MMSTDLLQRLQLMHMSFSDNPSHALNSHWAALGAPNSVGQEALKGDLGFFYTMGHQQRTRGDETFSQFSVIMLIAII